MPWFRVDDGFYDSPKVLSIPKRVRLAAVGTWTMAGTWCADKMTDGEVPAYALDTLGVTPAASRALVEAQLWVSNGSGGFLFVNWSKYQPTKSETLAKREQAAERQRKHRSVTRDKPVTNGVTEGSVTRDSHVSHSAPSRPDPSRPNPAPQVPQAHPPSTAPPPTSQTSRADARMAEDDDPGIISQALDLPASQDLTVPKNASPSRTSRAVTAAGDDDETFQRFWDAYSYKQDRKASRKAWSQAVKRADPEVIIRAAAEHRAWHERYPGGQSPKYPQGWLSGDRWEDDLSVRPTGERPSFDEQRQQQNRAVAERVFARAEQQRDEHRRAPRQIGGGLGSITRGVEDLDYGDGYRDEQEWQQWG